MCSTAPSHRIVLAFEVSSFPSAFYKGGHDGRAIQDSQESLRVLAKRNGINQKTVAKWRSRNSTADSRLGPRDARSSVLSIEEEAIIVAFRLNTLLPLDDCLYTLQATI